jgi:hypothetical protein
VVATHTLMCASEESVAQYDSQPWTPLAKIPEICTPGFCLWGFTECLGGFCLLSKVTHCFITSLTLGFFILNMGISQMLKGLSIAPHTVSALHEHEGRGLGKSPAP